MIVTAVATLLLASAAEATQGEYSPDPQAAVLGRQLFEAANDPNQPLDELLAAVEHPSTVRQLKLRALAFADLHLRGLKRFCLVQAGAEESAPPASFAHFPPVAFLASERARTAELLPRIAADVDAAWRLHARAYHDQVRSLKRACPGVPRGIQVVRHELKSAVGIPLLPDPATRGNLRHLIDDVVEILDVEASFPRVQFAANGLSYHLGLRAVTEQALLTGLHAFVHRYRTFATRAETRGERLLDLALRAGGGEVDTAVWLITFGFRNLPHIYDIYLLDPVVAAKLEILFLRLKHYRGLASRSEEKRLLHYPAGVYRVGDRLASPYHFWTGGYVAHQLLARGHRAEVAALLGGAAQGGYELAAALRYTVSHRSVDPNPLARLMHFFDRSATWEDSAAGLRGAFEVLDLALARREGRGWSPEYALLRTEADRFLLNVKALQPLYTALRSDPPRTDPPRSDSRGDE